MRKILFLLFILLAIFAHAQIADTSFYSNGKVFSIKQAKRRVGKKKLFFEPGG
ncbi:MAG: hypothetical protein IPJ51_00615 [Saprospiraceae bacterium]|nr:hypothetical protein [Saprospiraceae bacterium]